MASPRGPAQENRAAALGSRIRQLRRARGLTQRLLAAAVPMSAGNLSRIENGEQGPPSDESIARIAQALGADPDELLRLAGRVSSDRESFERLVLTRLDELRRELRDGFERLEVAIAGRGR